MTKTFLHFKFIQTSESGKTDIWHVLSQDHIRLGMITWHSHWRKYVFYPEDETLYDPKCLREIAEFMENETKMHIPWNTKRENRT